MLRKVDPSSIFLQQTFDFITCVTSCHVSQNMPGVVEVEHVGTQDIEIKSKKMSEAKKKIYAKNLKSTDACGKLVEQVIKAELWMSFVKKFK